MSIFFKKFFGNSYYKSRDYQYVSLLSQYDSYESYYKQLQTNNQIPVKSSLDIGFSKNINFGTDFKTVKKKLGDPTHFIDNLFKIFFYRLYVGGFKAKCELHFHDGKLFFYKYVFSNLNNQDKIQISTLISIKYLNETKDLSTLKIVDRNNNIIFINDDTDFTISYLNGKTEILSFIQTKVEENRKRKNIKHKLQESELLRML